MRESTTLTLPPGVLVALTRERGKVNGRGVLLGTTMSSSTFSGIGAASRASVSILDVAAAEG